MSGNTGRTSQGGAHCESGLTPVAPDDQVRLIFLPTQSAIEQTQYAIVIPKAILLPGQSNQGPAIV